ncbi:T6SS effector phospholipase Tle3 domain-containing protein, partial [Burkholderia anthina]|uniref:T6SS effector phospholipase Tle3 domain-containing protein n=1 Tax=Burkholderia anthina TaxID=179879 RepID=UPI003C7A3E2E
MTNSILNPKPIADGSDKEPSSQRDPPASSASRPKPPPIIVGRVEGVTMFAKGTPLICIRQMPLPGVVIFVHGVNSEGEWFDAAEEGLCKGLNRRIGRLDDQLMYHG